MRVEEMLDWKGLNSTGSVAQKHAIKRALGQDSVNCTQVFGLYHHFREKRTSVESDERPGIPLTSRNSETIESACCDEK
jgi:hypothetical protein